MESKFAGNERNVACNITIVAEERVAGDAFGKATTVRRDCMNFSAFSFNGRILCHNKCIDTAWKWRKEEVMSKAKAAEDQKPVE